MERKLLIEFKDEQDYTQFLDGLTLTDRDYTELDEVDKNEI